MTNSDEQQRWQKPCAGEVEEEGNKEKGEI